MKSGLLALAGLVMALGWVAPARAQGTIPARITGDFGPYSAYGPGLTYRPLPSFAIRMQAQTTVTVPDGGEALVARYSKVQEGRNENGTPLAGKLPYLGRAGRNSGYGRNTLNSSISVRARVIRLYEEEERQTGIGRE
jgi:Flp pilus assembly secretin CpaC